MLVDSAGTRITYGTGITYIRCARLYEENNNTTGKWRLRSADGSERNPYLEGTYVYPTGNTWEHDPSEPEVVVRIPAMPTVGMASGNGVTATGFPVVAPTIGGRG